MKIYRVCDTENENKVVREFEDSHLAMAYRKALAEIAGIDECERIEKEEKRTVGQNEFEYYTYCYMKQYAIEIIDQDEE